MSAPPSSRPAASRLVALVAACVAVVAACGAPAAAPNDRRVEIFGTFTEADADAFAETIAPVEQRLGIDVRFVGSSSFEADLQARVRRGEPPDLALLPQPGLLAELVRIGAVLPYDGALEEAVRDRIDPRLVELATIDGTLYGSWYRMSVKSLVWFSPSAFAELGFDIPTSWEALEALQRNAVAAGVAPWCMGVRDGAATGWAATDWIEDLLLRRSGPEAFDRWVTGELRFADPPVRDAFEAFADIARDGELVAGGAGSVVERSVRDAAGPLLEGPPGCLLHKQASFLPDLLDDRVEVAPDGELWAFPLPAPGGATPPVLIGGQLVTRFSDDADVVAVALALTDAEAMRAWAGRGGFLAPLREVPAGFYGHELERTADAWWRSAEVVRFDASDRMPAAVGVGTFWTGVTAYLGGAQLDATLRLIDASWPEPSDTAPSAAVPAAVSRSDG